MTDRLKQFAKHLPNPFRQMPTRQEDDSLPEGLRIVGAQNVWGGTIVLTLLAAFGVPTPWLIVVAFALLSWIATNYLATHAVVMLWCLREQQKTAHDAAARAAASPGPWQPAAVDAG